MSATSDKLSEIAGRAATDIERSVKLASIRVELSNGGKQGRYVSDRGRWSLAVSDPADGDPGQAALADPSPSTAPGGGEIPDTGSAKGGEPAGPSDPGQGGDGDPQAGAPTSAVVELPATVKFFDPARGFGFVIPDTGGREVFVHSSVLFRSGMTDLAPGQRVFVRAESAPRGLQATEIEPI